MFMTKLKDVEELKDMIRECIAVYVLFCRDECQTGCLCCDVVKEAWATLGRENRQEGISFVSVDCHAKDIESFRSLCGSVGCLSVFRFSNSLTPDSDGFHCLKNVDNEGIQGFISAIEAEIARMVVK